MNAIGTGPTSGQASCIPPNGINPAKYLCSYTGGGMTLETTGPANGIPSTIPLPNCTPNTEYVVTCTGLDANGNAITEPLNDTFKTPAAE